MSVFILNTNNYIIKSETKPVHTQRGGNSAVSVSDSVLFLIGIVSRYLSTKLSFCRKVSRHRRIRMSRVNAAQLGKNVSR